MKKIFALVLLAITASFMKGAIAQTMCGNELIEQEVLKDPYKKAYFQDYFKQYDEENRLMAQESERSAAKTTADFWIPVVFHIVLNTAQINQLGGQAAIIDRINTQLDVMNEDFNAKNADKNAVPSYFQPLVGNANISFAVAKRDAQGKAKLGIVWVNKDAAFTGYPAYDNQHSVKRSVFGGSDPWDVNKYINVWVTLIQAPTSGGQVLGYGFNTTYATNTNGDPTTAGIVLHYQALGRRTNVAQVFYNGSTDKGRTLTHELGHYFNIWHIWGKMTPAGDTACYEDDGIADTPEQEKANQACPAGIKPNCSNAPNPNGEMYMNFMDYSGDVCTKMFTVGQVTRMKSELGAGGQLELLGKNPQLCWWPNDVSTMEYNNKVDVAPNPTNGIFNITFADKYNRLDNIVITNTIGQVVRTIAVTDQGLMNYTVDASALPKGMYMVQLNFDEGVVSRKVMIQ